MNTEPAPKIYTEFLQKIENFERKISSPKPAVAPHEVTTFYETIKGANQDYKQTLKSTSVKVHYSDLAKKITMALQRLRGALDRNKAVIESAAASIPFTKLEHELSESIELFKKEIEAEGKKVGRKDSEQFPGAR